MSHEGDDLKGAFALFVFGGILLANGIKRYRRSKEIEDNASIPIAAAPQGKVEIQAFAWPSTTPVESFSKHCVYLSLRLEHLVQHGKSSSWDTVWSTLHNAPFFCVDQSGIAFVDANGASVEIESNIQMWKNLDEIEKNWLQKILPPISGFPPSTGFFSNESRYRIVEQAIFVGSPVLVEGEFSSSKPITVVPHAGIKKFQEKVKALKNMESQKDMRLFDKNHDGTISCEEFRDTFVFAANTVYATTDTSPIDLPHGMLHKSDNHELFIADCNSKYLLQRIGNWNITRMVAGAAMIALGVLILLVKIFP